MRYGAKREAKRHLPDANLRSSFPFMHSNLVTAFVVTNRDHKNAINAQPNRLHELKVQQTNL
jgi:hypothetical protein